MVELTRMDRALVRAEHWHRQQTRKASTVPYVAHLWGVASMVAEMGGSEDEIIAALLHDAVEDQGGKPTLDLIEQEFGPEVARIVLACSDSWETPKPPWRARKEAYLAHLKDADISVRRVSLADKIYNARSIVMELKAIGPSAFDKFSGKRDGTLWYYRQVSSILAEQNKGPWEEELLSLTDQMHHIIETI
jgi:(p)ppGpp synthase/HD superfamily hydrolase